MRRMGADRKQTAGAGTWTLGDRSVNRIGFGTKRLNDDPHTLLRLVVELGINHLDTASFYPSVASSPALPHDFTALSWANTVIREALAPYDDDLVIATKVGPLDEGMARPDQLRALVEQNLRELGRDHLDLVYLRQVGLVSLAEHFGVLADLRAQGLIRHLGLSNIRLTHLEEARTIAPVVAVQNRYAVDFGRVNDEMIEFCGREGIAFVPFFSLTAEGREAGGLADHDVVASVAEEYHVTPAQIRIAWTLSRGLHVLAIPGTGDPQHLRDNVAAGDLRLSPETLARLDRPEGE